MTEAPTVSVVIPFLNPDRGFLNEAIESVLMQDYRPLEIILVDDGSRETIDKLLNEWPIDDKVLIRLLSHEDRENRGCSASRNLGISESTGKYIAFLDADDVWLPGKLREQCEIMEQDSSLSMVFGLTQYWFSWDSRQTIDNRDFTPRARFSGQVVLEPPDFLTGMLRGRFIVPSHSGVMVRKNTVLKCGGYEEDFPGLYEDQVLIAKLALSHKVCASTKLWDKYRQHNNSMTAQIGSHENEYASRDRFISWLDNYFRQSGLRYPELSEAIAKDRWLARSNCARTGSTRYRLIRWAKKWLLRIEERAVPARFRWRYWLGDS